MIYSTVIVADGTFPSHEIPLAYLRNAERIICCDGSTANLIDFGLEPTAITGDMDYLSPELYDRFSDRVFPDSSQETNDLTKAVAWCRNKGYVDIVIVGATGKREDHTIGNISLLAEYSSKAHVIMVTDTGVFRTYLESATIETFRSQQVSIFSINPETEITTEGLKYPLNKARLNNWWNATLNEALGDSFRIEFTNGRIIVYLKFL